MSVCLSKFIVIGKYFYIIKKSNLRQIFLDQDLKKYYLVVMWQLNKIPKVVNLFLNFSNLSILHFLTFKTLRELNPELTINLHKFENLQSFEYKKQILDLKVNIIEHKEIFSDNLSVQEMYMKFFILNNYGGIFSDLDIFYLKPLSFYFEKQAGNIFDFISFFEETDGSITTAFMVSSPQNIFCQRICENIEKTYKKNQAVVIDDNFFKKILKNEYWNIKIIMDNAKSFQPISCYELEKIFFDIPFFEYDYVFGLRWYKNKAISLNFIEEVTEKNIFYKNNLFSKYFKNVTDFSVIIKSQFTKKELFNLFNYLVDKDLKENYEIIVFDNKKEYKEICQFFDRSLQIKYLDISKNKILCKEKSVSDILPKYADQISGKKKFFLEPDNYNIFDLKNMKEIYHE